MLRWGVVWGGVRSEAGEVWEFEDEKDDLR